MSLQSLKKHLAQLAAPVLFLLVGVFAFGLQIPWLGYYLDDWIILNALNLGGAERIFEYAFIGNRPLVFWFWWLSYELLGSAPIYWQIWALVWRWLTVVIIWMGWRLVWPKSSRQLAAAGLLFAVYPLFKQQPTALTFTFHWISYFFYGLSIYWMLRSLRRGERFYPFLFGALLFDFLQLFSQEFYVGIELFRPVLIWLALRSIYPDWKDRLKRTLFYWAPYLIVFGLYLYWRMALMPTPGSDRNTPTVLYSLLVSPLQAIVKLATMLFQDVVEMLVGVWFRTMTPILFTPSPFSNLFAWALAIATILLLLAYFRWLQPHEQAPAAIDTGDEPWYRTAIPVGFIAMILGFAPGWTTGRHIYDLNGIYNDRFGMAAMFGASLLVVGLIELLVHKHNYRVVLACLLVGLAVGHGSRVTTDYRWSWEKQLRLYWQLKWRAPDIQPQTAVFGDGSVAGYIGSWASVSVLNLMYWPISDQHYMDYWYVDLGKTDIPYLLENNDPIRDQKNFMLYQAPSRDSLVISFKPEDQQCLWVLSEKDQSSSYLTENERMALPISDLSRILPQSRGDLREDIFGQEPAHDWCYYFEKADLARQYSRWDEVVSLWQQAEQNGLSPAVGIEYSPFIEGFAHTGDFDQALTLSHKAFFPDYVMRSYLCDTWKRVGDSLPDASAHLDVFTGVMDEFGCDNSILPGQ